MTNRRHALVAGAFFALFALAANALQAAGNGIAQLEKFMQHAQRAQGQFSQHVERPDGQGNEDSAGEFAFQRPDRFRWHYKQPWPQLLVSDGETMWSWDPDLNQATRQTAHSALAATPAAVLADSAALHENFTLENIAVDGSELAWVRARARQPDSAFALVELGLSDNLLRQMRIHDQFGQRSDITLHDIHINPTLPANSFVFSPPPEADIIDAPASP